LLRDLTIGTGLFLLVGLSYGLTYWKGGNDMENKLLAEDHSKLTASTQELVNIFHTLSGQVSEVASLKDDTIAGPALNTAARIVWPLPRKPTINPNPGSSNTR